MYGTSQQVHKGGTGKKAMTSKRETAARISLHNNSIALNSEHPNMSSTECDMKLPRKLN
jgi:hypothetical protein